MTRHVLGVLGVIAAGVLLAVSAMMNYRFGYTLGKTPSDGHIYGLASAAADCFKALVPFFFFAAWRNRMWSQSVAAAAVWFVVTGYSMTSALGHAALNRLDTAGQRTLASTSYKDLRADKKRYEEQLSWLPRHRAVAAVKAELEAHKANRWWTITAECQETAGKAAREYCSGYHKLDAELGNALEAVKLNAKIEVISGKLANSSGATVMAEADPQATVLSKMTGVEVETVQTALTLFVALLIEIGSGFGMYVAFAYWRPHGPQTPPAPSMPAMQQVAVRQDAIWSEGAPAAELAAPPPALEPPVTRSLDDNGSENTARSQLMPPNDVELFYKEGVVHSSGDSITSQDLYDAYKLWAKSKDKRRLHHARFSEEFERLGHKTVQVLDRQRYPDITLTAEFYAALEKKASRKRKAAQVQESPEVQEDSRVQDAQEAKVVQLRAA